MYMLTDTGASSESQQQSAATAEGAESAAGAQPQSLKCDELVNGPFRKIKTLRM